MRFIEEVADLQNSRAQRLNVNEELLRSGVIENEDESELTLSVHAVQVDGLILEREKRLELEGKNIRISITVDFEDFNTGHVNNSERVVGHKRVKAKGVVQWGLYHNRPASLCVHVKQYSN